MMMSYVRKRNDVREENHVMALHVALLAAIESQNEAIVRRLLRDYNYDKVPYADKTLLTKACEEGATSIVQILLDSNLPRRLINYAPHLDIAADDSDLTALESACKGNHVGCLELLLKCKNIALLSHEYPTEAKSAFSHSDNTLKPLTIALKYNSLACAERLLSNVQERGIKFCVTTACHDAVQYNHFEIFKKLLALQPEAGLIDENQNVTDCNQNRSEFPSKNQSQNNNSGSQLASTSNIAGNLTSGQRDAINVALVTAAFYNRVETLRHLLSLSVDVNHVAEVEIPQLVEEPELDNVFYDLTGESCERVSVRVTAV